MKKRISILTISGVIFITMRVIYVILLGNYPLFNPLNMPAYIVERFPIIFYKAILTGVAGVIIGLIGIVAIQCIKRK